MPSDFRKDVDIETAPMGWKQKREATLLLAPPYEAFALPCQSNEQRDLTPYAYIHATRSIAEGADITYP